MTNCDGLALCGGGAKGAFQIGALTALDEIGCLKNIKFVAGTSVGALNAVLFALGDLDYAKEIWHCVILEDFLSPNIPNGKSIFKTEGLKKILDKVPLEELRNKLPVFVNIRDKKRKRIETLKINNFPRCDIINTLLASTSIPLVYGNKNIYGIKYIDGGWTPEGNTPIRPLYQNGCRNIIICALDNEFELEHISKNFRVIHTPINPKEKIEIEKEYPNVKFMVIKPLENLNPFDTLKFTSGFIDKCMLNGYQDTMKIYKPDVEQYEDVSIYKDDKGGEEMGNSNYMRINMQIQKLMGDLFHSSQEIEAFITKTNFSNVNLDLKTLGGKIFYTDIWTGFGWKVQQHNFGVLGNKIHIRILDPNNVRRAWILSPQKFLDALRIYRDADKFS